LNPAVTQASCGSAGLKRRSPRLAGYSFLYQLTHLTKDRGALTHDDRVDAVAGAVAHFQRAMMMDVDQAAKAMRDEEMQAEIEDFIEGFNQPTFRGMRINGQRIATWSSRDGWSGDTRPDAEWLH
jgi:hypothetical protein